MSMALEMRAKSGVLHVKATGKFSLAEAKTMFVELVGVVVHHKVDKVFFDGRRINGDPKLIERFYYGEFAARTVINNASSFVRFAYVLKEPLLDPGRLGET